MIRPDSRACRGVQRKYIVVPGSNIHHAVDHKRRHFHRHFRVADTGVENPRWFQLGDIRRVDLVDVRKSRVINISSVVWPVKSLRTQRFDEECATEQCNSALRYRETKLS